jgi:hypothetical protein
MRFFVPLAQDEAEAEYVWAGVRLYLSELGLATTRRRIRALSLSPDLRRRVEVGLDLPDDPGPVLLILESADINVFFACTPMRGVLSDVPWALALSREGRAIDFDEEVVGWA